MGENDKTELPEGWEWIDYWGLPVAAKPITLEGPRPRWCAMIEALPNNKFDWAGDVPPHVRGMFHARCKQMGLRLECALPDDPFEAIGRITAHWCGDWAADERLAWLYGIVTGWNDESLADLTRDYGWSQDALDRLKRQRAQFVACDANHQSEIASVRITCARQRELAR